MIFTLKPLKSEEIMEAPRRVWKQSLYVKAGGPLISIVPILEHSAPASQSDLCKAPHQQPG